MWPGLGGAGTRGGSRANRRTPACLDREGPSVVVIGGLFTDFCPSPDIGPDQGERVPFHFSKLKKKKKKLRDREGRSDGSVENSQSHYGTRASLPRHEPSQNLLVGFLHMEAYLSKIHTDLG